VTKSNAFAGYDSIPIGLEQFQQADARMLID
jgi:hypothetical protein